MCGLVSPSSIPVVVVLLTFMTSCCTGQSRKRASRLWSNSIGWSIEWTNSNKTKCARSRRYVVCCAGFILAQMFFFLGGREGSIYDRIYWNKNGSIRQNLKYSLLVCILSSNVVKIKIKMYYFSLQTLGDVSQMEGDKALVQQIVNMC